jgi:signal transduction histidine kinase
MPLRRTDVPLDSLLESFTDPWVVLDPAGGLIFGNRAARALLGDDPARWSGQPIEAVLEARRREGRTIPVELERTPIEAAGRPLVLARMRSDPEGIAQVRDEFLSTLAHELRTPLQSMLGWTQWLRTPAPRDEATVARALEVIERNIRRQAEVIDGLIDLAEILSGPLRLDVRTVRADVLLSAILDRFAEQARGQGIRIVRAVEGAEVPVLTDPDRLERVLERLVANALRFTPRGGEVEVEASTIGSFLRIAVRDTGVGIDPVLLPHLFDDARMADESLAAQWPGVRLSVVRRLIELQGGNVSAHSEGIGRGASFVVSLPLSESARRS